MVVDLFQQLHDEYIEATRAWHQDFCPLDLWYSDDAANETWDPDLNSEIPF